ncbi:hypothetical protein F503_05877 [Ophiostoma piceae UAMH 11346]|uniref:Uncharacterized protein n=1 Tax=Ophiostoma piceae (strain UAMH 11346) TaxID=1262450 RepID=S3CCZ3_OPHP1|nr:hypothetical protein F503_05877 [Ophiostoma piceae UAMH 11346]
MAAHSTLAPAPGADNEDLFDARDISHARDSDAARTAEGDGPQTHPAKLVPMSGAVGASHTGTDTGTTEHPHNRYHRYLSHSHHLHHDHKPRLLLHRPHSKTPLISSEASTPSRTRSASSSLYTISSTFPSSAPVHTPIDGPSLHVIEAGTDSIETPNDDNLNSRVNTDPPNKIATSHDSQALTDSLFLEAAVLPAVSSQNIIPLSTPPTASLPSHTRRTERDSGASYESLSLSLNHSQSQSQSLALRNIESEQDLSRSREGEARDDIIDCHQEGSEFAIQDLKGGSVYDTAGVGDVGVNGSEAESIDSQTLALDQTRLRIAYLVSTMVTPSANALVDATAVGAAAGAGEDAKDASRLASTAPTPLYGRDELANQEASEVGHYMEQCPRGWNHTELAKKREKITQILYWQSEVTELGDDSVYCGCSVGTATPYDENDDSGVGFTPVVQPRSQASSEAGMPRLSTVASGVTTVGTSAAGPDRSSTASPSSSMSAPSSSLTSSLSSSPSPGSPSLRSSRPCCHGCKKLLMPPRTVVFVSSSSDDFPWVQRAEDGGRSNSGFRKAIRALCGIIGLSKRKRDKTDPSQNGLQNPDVAKIANSGGGNALFFAVPDLTGVQLVGPASPILNQRKKSIPEAKVWDLWEKTNCSYDSFHFTLPT